VVRLRRVHIDRVQIAISQGYDKLQVHELLDSRLHTDDDSDGSKCYAIVDQYIAQDQFTRYSGVGLAYEMPTGFTRVTHTLYSFTKIESPSTGIDPIPHWICQG
jgi:hypothetical protein